MYEIWMTGDRTQLYRFILLLYPVSIMEFHTLFEVKLCLFFKKTQATEYIGTTDTRYNKWKLLNRKNII